MSWPSILLDLITSITFLGGYKLFVNINVYAIRCAFLFSYQNVLTSSVFLMSLISYWALESTRIPRSDGFIFMFIHSFITSLSVSVCGLGIGSIGWRWIYPSILLAQTSYLSIYYPVNVIRLLTTECSHKQIIWFRITVFWDVSLWQVGTNVSEKHLVPIFYTQYASIFRPKI
jgi:hypothetical protein